MHMNVAICRLNDSAKLPTHGSEWAAGYDLYACLDYDNEVYLAPGETKKIGTGIAVAIPHDYFGAICARSGLATKHGLRPANCLGIVDADYRGEVIVALHNDSSVPYTVKHGERIAQLVIMPFLPVEFREVDHLAETKRGSGGFGSTGTK